MIRFLRCRLTYANVVATLALLLAMSSGTALALTIGGGSVINGSLTGQDLATDSVRSIDVAGLRPTDFGNTSVLPIRNLPLNTMVPNDAPENVRTLGKLNFQAVCENDPNNPGNVRVGYLLTSQLDGILIGDDPSFDDGETMFVGFSGASGQSAAGSQTVNAVNPGATGVWTIVVQGGLEAGNAGSTCSMAGLIVQGGILVQGSVAERGIIVQGG